MISEEGLTSTLSAAHMIRLPPLMATPSTMQVILMPARESSRSRLWIVSATTASPP